MPMVMALVIRMRNQYFCILTIFCLGIFMHIYSSRYHEYLVKHRTSYFKPLFSLSGKQQRQQSLTLPKQTNRQGRCLLWLKSCLQDSSDFFGTEIGNAGEKSANLDHSKIQLSSMWGFTRYSTYWTTQNISPRQRGQNVFVLLTKTLNNEDLADDNANKGNLIG